MKAKTMKLKHKNRSLYGELNIADIIFQMITDDNSMRFFITAKYYWLSASHS